MSFQAQPQFQPMTYIITGAARGIGRHLALSLVSRGARVVLLDANMDELSNTLSLLSKRQQYRDQFVACECDLKSRLQIRNAVDSARRFLGGRLDCLINNAMAMPHTWPHGGGMDEGDEAEIMRHWDAQIAVGLSAPFYLSRLCVPMLKREGWKAGAKASEGDRPGCVINVSSTRATQAEMDHEGYSAAKAGLVGLTQSLSVSLGTRYGIRVNAVLPGWIDVQAENKAADEKGTKWAEGISKEEHAWQLNGRVGKPEDVMEAVDYLVGSTFMTGQEITVSGGVERRMVYPED